MKKYFLFVLVILLMSACEKFDEEKQVRYLISNCESGFNVTYRDENGTLIKKDISTLSAEDKWSYSFTGKQGEIVYVSAIYKDITSEINVQILVDEKLLKQASSKYDTLNFVTVSGTIPY